MQLEAISSVTRPLPTLTRLLTACQGWVRPVSEEQVNGESLKNDLLSLVEWLKLTKWFSYSVHACWVCLKARFVWKFKVLGFFFLNYFICIVQRQYKDSGAVNFTSHGSEIEFFFCIIQTFFLSVSRWVLDMALRKCQSRHLFLVYKSLFNNFKGLTTTKKWSTNTLVLILSFALYLLH